MATLASGIIDELWRDIQRDLSDRREAWGALTKADLRAAIVAMDGWLDDNAAALNSAIPQPARGALTQAQKALIVAFIALKRAGR